MGLDLESEFPKFESRNAERTPQFMGEETGARRGSGLSCVTGLKPDFQANSSFQYGRRIAVDGRGWYCYEGKVGGKNTCITFVFLSSGPNKHSQGIISTECLLNEGSGSPSNIVPKMFKGKCGQDKCKNSLL